MPPLSILIWLPALCGVLGALLSMARSQGSPAAAQSTTTTEPADEVKPGNWSVPGVIALLGTLGALGLAIACIAQYGPGSHGLKDVTDVVWIAELGIHYKLGVSGLNVLLIGLMTLLFFTAVLASNLRSWDRPRLFYFQ